MAIHGDMGWRVRHRKGRVKFESISSDDDRPRNLGRLKRAILRLGGEIISTQRCQYMEGDADKDAGDWYDVEDEVSGVEN